MWIWALGSKKGPEGYIGVLRHRLARFKLGRTECGSQARGKTAMRSLLGNLHLQGSFLLHIAG